MEGCVYDEEEDDCALAEESDAKDTCSGCWFTAGSTDHDEDECHTPDETYPDPESCEEDDGEWIGFLGHEGENPDAEPVTDGLYDKYSDDDEDDMYQNG